MDGTYSCGYNDAIFLLGLPKISLKISILITFTQRNLFFLIYFIYRSVVNPTIITVAMASVYGGVR